MLRKLIITFLLFGFTAYAHAQKMRLSIASDISLQRSLKEGQRYWAGGQTVSVHFNLAPQDAAYAWYCYYFGGKTNNDLTAMAKDPATLPQQINYRVLGKIGYRQMSIGWKHYLKGRFDSESWNLYSLLGFGLVFGSAENSSTVPVDTALYNVSVLTGKGRFKRLTYDLGLGFEQPMGGDIFIYSEVKTFIPATDYPSKFLYKNDDAPLTACLNLGFRILF